MAELKNKASEDDEDAIEEVFTDLHGNPDPVPEDGEDSLDTVSEDDPLNLDSDQGEKDEAETGTEGPKETEEVEEVAEVLEPEIDTHDLRLREERFRTLNAFAENLELRDNFAKGAAARADADIARSTKAIKAAKEAGDTDAEMAASQELLNARDVRTKAQEALSLMEGQRGQLRTELFKIGYDTKTGRLVERTTEETGGSTIPGEAKGAKSTKLSPLATKFLAANPWVKDPKYKTEFGKLLALDNYMASLGKDKAKPEYFSDLASRFNSEIKPGLVRGLDGKLVATGARERGRGGAGAMPTGGTARSQKPVNPKDIKLDNADLKLMRQFGMDPNKKEHRAEMLRSKRGTEMQFAGRA